MENFKVKECYLMKILKTVKILILRILPLLVIAGLVIQETLSLIKNRVKEY